MNVPLVEIAAQRRAERRMQVAAEEADSLCRRLVDVYRCDFVIAEQIPEGMWARLPWDWQSGVENPVAVRWGKPPCDLRGPVAVSLASLRRIGRDAS